MKNNSASATVLLESILREGITKQQARHAALLCFPFSEIDNVHVAAEPHRHRTVMPPADAAIVIRIRTIAGVIVSVWPKGRTLVGFPHDIGNRVKDTQFVSIGSLAQKPPPVDHEIVHDVSREL